MALSMATRALADLWESPSILIAFLPLFVVLFSTSQFKFKRTDHSKIYELGGLPILSGWLFFNRRYDFICSTFKKTGQNMFRFRVLQHHVVALSGEEGRKVFFSDKTLDLVEGYRLLGASAPNAKDIDIRVEESTPFVKHVLALSRRDRLANMIPRLLDDMNVRMEAWGASGTLDPFKEMYNLVFQMTLRLSTCRQLADDAAASSKLAELFLLHENSNSTWSFILPWLSARHKERATRGLWDILAHYVDVQRKCTTSDAEDAIDLLIAQGYEDSSIIASTLGVVFAAAINTGITACWIMIYLGDKPEWKARVYEEVKTLLFAHGIEAEADHRRLASVPLDAWEDMPILEAVLKETIRLTISGTALRRNVGGDLFVARKKIRDKEFLAYPLGDVHMDATLYPDPLVFDPGRFLNRPDVSGIFPFLGWGAGRHPCAGMRTAKLEIKLALVLLLCRFDYEIVDRHGNLPRFLPQPDRNDIQNAKPVPGNECFVRYRKR